MSSGWVKSAAARRILVHWADPRPAWLWSGDGSRLLWRNAAARLFGAKLKKSGLKLLADPVPIKGQVARLIRLGSPGRSSLSRIQFLAGGRPASTTCTVTPLELEDGAMAALIVGVDPIEPEVLAAAGEEATDALTTALLPARADFAVVAPDGTVTASSAGAAERIVPTLAAQDTTDSATTADGTPVAVTRLKASSTGHQLLLVEAITETSERTTVESVRSAEGLDAFEATPAREPPEEPLLPMGLPPAATAPEAELETPDEPPPEQSLSSLFDRLADHDPLYGELSAADEQLGSSTSPTADTTDETPTPDAEKTESAPAGAQPDVTPQPDVIAAVIEFDEDLHDDRAVNYRVTGRGFTPAASAVPAPLETAPQQPATPEMPAAPAPEQPDSDSVERASRYNFDELSRILADRVSGEPPAIEEGPVEIEPPIEPPRQPAAVSEGALINIAAETFILNRLPLGIMVFRDQQVLFANRALADLVGYDTIDGLRSAGLASIFPPDDATVSGPVTRLVRRDGTQFPVTARLQSITWHGRPALMLSAAPAIGQSGHEGAVRAFAEIAAEVREEGYIEADRNGLVTAVSPNARLLLGATREAQLAGELLAGLVHGEDIAALRAFLERPARFAESARPSIRLRAAAPATELLLFAEGQAGIVSGYFGFVQPLTKAAPAGETQDGRRDEDEVDPSMLARVSRGVRRPLNTIIGFADLIRSAAFGTIENHRYLEYARDIRTAGQEIAVLVDELDDYARLRLGSYATRPAELDLAALLESCIVRVRGQASAARVLVRSAISERLPHVRADRASLGQAILNLLASAIDQTPSGGSVVLSAQLEEDGHVGVNIRDGGAASVDPGERFVVFRDGVGKDGETLAPVRSSVGLALTRALVAVNACTLTVAPAGNVGTLFSLSIPPDLVAAAATA